MASKSIGTLAMVLAADTRRLAAGLQKGERRVKQFENRAKRSMLAVKRAVMGLAAFVIGRNIFSGFMQEMKRLDEIAKTSRRIGIATEELSALHFAFEQTGTEMAATNKGLQMFMRNISDAAFGTGEASDALELLELNARDMYRKDVSEQLKMVADGMQGIENATVRTSIATDLFGGRNRTMINLLMDGREEMEKLTAQAERLGIVVDSKAAKAAEDFNDANNRLKSSLRGMVGLLAEYVVPTVTVAIDKITKFVSGLRNTNLETVKLNAKLVAFGLAFALSIKIMGKVVTAIASITKAIRAMTKAQVIALSLSPKGWAVLAASVGVAAAAMYGVDKAFDSVEESMREAGAEIAEVSKETEDLAAQMEAAEEATKNAEAEMARLQSRADAIFAETRTDQERFIAGMEELWKLRDLGLIDQDTFDRAAEALDDARLAASGMADEVERAMRAMEARTQKVLDMIKTDAEKLEEEIENVLELASLRQITGEQAARAIEMLREKFAADQGIAGSGPVQNRTDRINLGAIGAAMASGRGRDKVEENTAEEVVESKKQTALLVELERSGTTPPIVVTF